MSLWCFWRGVFLKHFIKGQTELGNMNCTQSKIRISPFLKLNVQLCKNLFYIHVTHTCNNWHFLFILLYKTVIHPCKQTLVYLMHKTGIFSVVNTGVFGCCNKHYPLHVVCIYNHVSFPFQICWSLNGSSPSVVWRNGLIVLLIN